MKNENNLVWIDLEMTGLDYRTDVILEIATIITDKDLNILHEGPEFIIHQPKTVLDAMNKFCKELHAKNGLTAASLTSKTTVQEACAATLAVIQEYCPPQQASLCGNTVWQDRNFLKQYMPDITDYLNYRLVDVTAIKRLTKLWYPDRYVEFGKKDNHRALPDIKESIEELRYYRKNFFIQK